MSRPFSITATTVDNSDYIAFEGNVDVSAEAHLKELPAKVRHTEVRFDFSQVGRINSMGIALLLRCLKNIRAEKNAAIYLRGLNQTNAILFKMTGIFLLASHEKSDERIPS
jgi:anti-anti-sigma regulatory factor